MPRTNAIAELAKVMTKLLAQRKKHLAIVARSSAKVAEVDDLLGKFGITLAAPKPAGKKARAGRKPGRRRHRQVFSETANEFVLGLLKGGKSLTSAEINKAWKKAGRKGMANNTLTKLFQGKQIKRQKAKEGKGSVYSAA